MHLIDRFGAMANGAHRDHAVDRLDDPPGPYGSEPPHNSISWTPSPTRRRAASTPFSGFATPTNTPRHVPVSTT